MGAYCSEPVVEKSTENGENDRLKYGAASMQGWRINQEDAHNCIVDYDENIAFFGVYDGHGGPEVALYISKYFPDFLKAHKLWKEGRVADSLETSFLEFDDLLRQEEAKKELREIAGKKEEENDNKSEEGDTPEEKMLLLEEACTPLEQILKRYGLSFQAEKERLLGSKKAKKFLSPNLRSKVKKKIQKEETVIEGELAEDGKVIVQCEQVITEEKVATELDLEQEDPPTPPSSPQNEGQKKGLKRDHSEQKEVDEAQSIQQSPSPKRVKQHCDENCGSESNDTSDSNRACIVNGNGCEQSMKQQENEDNIMAKSKLDKDEGHADSPTQSPKAEERLSEAKQLLSQVDSPSRRRTSKSESEVQAVAKSLDRAAANIDKNMGTWNTVSHLSPNVRATETPETATAASSSDDGEEEEEKEDKDFEMDQENQSSSDDDDEEECTESDSSSSSDSDDMNEMMDGELEEGEVIGYDEEEEMFQVPSGDTPGDDSGSTACIALIFGNKLYVSNVGDSRCVLSRGGKAVDLSQDHKPEDDVEKTRIEKAGGRISMDGRVNGGLNLSRALGDHFYKKNDSLALRDQMISALPDIRVEPLQTDDQFVILACDGIWNSLTSQEVVDFVSERHKKQIPLETICEQLCDSCLAPNTVGDGTGCDNMTVILTAFKQNN